MAQIKIYGVKGNLLPVRNKLSEVIHSCTVDALGFPPDKKFHRFIYLDKADFFYAPGRSEKYTIIEISIFEGRSVIVKKNYIKLLFERIKSEVDIFPEDIEITIFETPKHNWGIRGQAGDELALDYKTEI